MAEADPEVLRRLRRLEADAPPDFGVYDGRTWPAAPTPPAGSDAKELMLAQNRRVLERRAAAEAEELRQSKEREDAENRARAIWEANRPVREAALAELTVVQEELEKLDAEREPIMARIRHLREVANH